MSHFIPVAQHCGECPRTYYVGGSFLKPLVWWDYANGKDLETQLGRLSETLLRREAMMAAKFVLGEKSRVR